MTQRPSSRISGFYQLTPEERRARLLAAGGATRADLEALLPAHGLTLEVADKMVENVIGVLGMPVGLGLNFTINGKDRLVPMAVEEPSVIAAVSFVARLARDGGGFQTDVDPPMMIGQVQVVELADVAAAARAVTRHKRRIMEAANACAPRMSARGGGCKDVEVRILRDEPDADGRTDGGGDMLCVHLVIDCREAMGANAVNEMAEGVAGTVEDLTGGRVVLRILSNLADRRRARASCTIPFKSLQCDGYSGEEVARGIVDAWRFARRDPYRAATHNKGILNGIDAVALATGNDWRAVEAGAHAYAARDGRYTSLTRYEIRGQALHASIELPMAVGVIGGTTSLHPAVLACRRILHADSAGDLAGVMAAVGLSQNLGALRALATEGIQRGHMALHARQVALAAGATGALVDEVAARLVAMRQVKLDAAKEIMAEMGARHARSFPPAPVEAEAAAG
ncbi:MAG: hydroxymethylglutaryl-CoA reductase, degradative [Deltaproteobacteria bacterium]|nr:hydroxymethylglutaryl-CoA reductase, degradative [Deltaproteobacteria bacterium]